MILAERLVGERLPFAGLRRRHHHPLPEHLAPAGRVEEVRSGHGKGTPVHRRSVSLNTIPVRERPNTIFPGRFTHGIPNTFPARASSCQAQIASTMSS